MPTHRRDHLERLLRDTARGAEGVGRQCLLFFLYSAGKCAESAAPKINRSQLPKNCPFSASVVSLTEQSGRIVYSVDQRVAGHDEVPLGRAVG